MPGLTYGFTAYLEKFIQTWDIVFAVKYRSNFELAIKRYRFKLEVRRCKNAKVLYRVGKETFAKFPSEAIEFETDFLTCAKSVFREFIMSIRLCPVGEVISGYIVSVCLSAQGSSFPTHFTVGPDCFNSRDLNTKAQTFPYRIVALPQSYNNFLLGRFIELNGLCFVC